MAGGVRVCVCMCMYARATVALALVRSHANWSNFQYAKQKQQINNVTELYFHWARRREIMWKTWHLTLIFGRTKEINHADCFYSAQQIVYWTASNLTTAWTFHVGPHHTHGAHLFPSMRWTSAVEMCCTHLDNRWWQQQVSMWSQVAQFRWLAVPTVLCHVEFPSSNRHCHLNEKKENVDDSITVTSFEMAMAGYENKPLKSNWMTSKSAMTIGGFEAVFS